MEFKQLEAYVAVIDYNSFTEAARRLYLTQPTISAHVRSLEKELHTRLIIRTTRHFTVTRRGCELYDYAVHMLNMRNHLVEDFTGNKRKVIDLSASTIPSTYMLPELLSKFSKLEPDVHFHVWQSDSGDAIQKVVEGTVDFGLVGTKTSNPSCEFILFSEDSLVIATPVNEHYQKLQGKAATLADFQDAPFIMRKSGSGTRREVDLLLERNHVDPTQLNIVAHMNDLESIKKSVSAGLGISIVSACSVKDMEKINQILLFPLKESAAIRSFYIVCSKDRILKPHVRQFIKFVQGLKKDQSNE